MEEWLTRGLIYVGGIGTALIGKIGDKWIEAWLNRRRDSKVLAGLLKQMPDVIQAMESSLKTEPLDRVFVVLPQYSAKLFNVQSIAYYWEDYEQLVKKMDVLQSKALIEALPLAIELTRNQIQKYRMSDHFASLLGTQKGRRSVPNEAPTF